MKKCITSACIDIAIGVAILRKNPGYQAEE